MNGKLSSEDSISLNAPASTVTYAGGINFHEPLSRVFFIKLRLLDATGKLLSENFYWQTHPEKGDVFTTLNDMPAVELQAAATRADSGSNTVIEVTLQNASANVALMSHIQLRRADNGERVLPAYYSGNYVSLLGGESKTVQIECSTAALQGSAALITVDGWNVTVAPSQAPGVAVKTNENALVSHWPKTGLPFQQY
jgi:beta-mannosidase